MEKSLVLFLLIILLFYFQQLQIAKVPGDLQSGEVKK